MNDNEVQPNFTCIADLQDELLSINFQDGSELNQITQKLLSSPLLDSKWTFRSVLVSIYTCYLCRPHSECNYINLFLNIAKHPNNSFQSDDYVANFSNKFFIFQLYNAGLVDVNSIYMKANHLETYRDYFFPEIKENFPDTKLLTKESYERMKNSIVQAGYQYDENDIQSYLNKFIEFRSKGQNPNIITAAIRNDDIDNLQKLLSQTNTSVDQKVHQSIFERFIFIKSNDPSLIEYAAYFGSINCFKFLYQKIKKMPETVSSFAIAGGNYEIIHLVEQSQVKFSDESLTTSIRFFRSEITSYLEETYNIKKTINDATRSVVYYNLRSLIECDEIIRKNPNEKDSHGHTILSLASLNGDLDVIKYLIKTYENIDINAQTKTGYTPLHYSSSKGHFEIVKYFSSFSNININAINEKKYTALHYACKFGSLNIVKFLCSLPNIDINADCERNFRPIDIATKNGYIEIIKFLSSLPNIKIYDINSKGKSIIEYSVMSKSFEVVKLVLNLLDKFLIESNEVHDIIDFKNTDVIYNKHMQSAYNLAFQNETNDIFLLLETEIFGNSSSSSSYSSDDL